MLSKYQLVLVRERCKWQINQSMYYLDMFFGGGGGRGRRERKGKDVVHQMGVTLEELYNGSVRKLALQKNVICDSCEGKLGCYCKSI